MLLCSRDGLDCRPIEPKSHQFLSKLQIIKPILQAQKTQTDIKHNHLTLDVSTSAIKNKTHRSSFVSAPSASNSKLADDIPSAASLADAKNNILMVIVVEDIVSTPSISDEIALLIGRRLPEAEGCRAKII